MANYIGLIISLIGILFGLYAIVEGRKKNDREGGELRLLNLCSNKKFDDYSGKDMICLGILTFICSVFLFLPMLNIFIG